MVSVFLLIWQNRWFYTRKIKYKMHYVEPLLKSEIKKLLTLQQCVKKKLSGKQKLESYQDFQIFGGVLLKEVFNNVTPGEFFNAQKN